MQPRQTFGSVFSFLAILKPIAGSSQNGGGILASFEQVFQSVSAHPVFFPRTAIARMVKLPKRHRLFDFCLCLFPAQGFAYLETKHFSVPGIQPSDGALVRTQDFTRSVGAGSTDAVHVACHLNLRMLVGPQPLHDLFVVFYKTKRITVALKAKRAQKMMWTKFDFFPLPVTSVNVSVSISIAGRTLL